MVYKIDCIKRELTIEKDFCVSLRAKVTVKGHSLKDVICWEILGAEKTGACLIIGIMKGDL